VIGKSASRLDALLALVCGLFLLTAYHANRDFLPGDDATGNIMTAAHFLEGRGATFTPAGEPYMFFWDLLDQSGSKRVLISDWKALIDGVPAEELHTRGNLRLRGPDYYLVPCKRSSSVVPAYVSIFGPGTALFSLPVFLASRWIWGDKLLHDPMLLWYAGKTAASIFVAASGAIIYMIARRFLSRGAAILIALSYGLGTCVWSTSSQTLWQHGPNEFFLALGTYFLVRLDAATLPSSPFPFRPALAAGCGLSYACAGACRPTSFIVVICVAVYLLVRRRSFPAYLLGTLPPVIAIALYNAHYLGSPWAFGQMEAASSIALEKTGASGVWQTPLWVGLAGHLFSPSRGLLIFSPFLLFSVVGIYRAWREPRWSFLRPLSLAVAIVLIIESKHFDWWSGWAYGYRHIVDTCVFLALFLMPAAGWFLTPKWLVLYVSLLVWSIAVQVVGACAYDVVGWNYRWLGYRVLTPGRPAPVTVADSAELQHALAQGASSLGQIQGDIDLPQYRYRLWSVTDNEIGYYLKHFWASREIKHALMKQAKGGT
jgi:hypothetical protein